MAKQSKVKEFNEGWSEMMNLAYDFGCCLASIQLHLHLLANPQSQSESSRHLKVALAEAENAQHAWLEGGLYGWIMSEEREARKRRLEVFMATIDEAQEALEKILQKRGIPGVKQVTSTRHQDPESKKTFVRFEVQLDTGLPDQTAEILYDFPEEEIQKVSVTPRHEKFPSDLDKMLENGIDNQLPKMAASFAKKLSPVPVGQPQPIKASMASNGLMTATKTAGLKISTCKFDRDATEAYCSGVSVTLLTAAAVDESGCPPEKPVNLQLGYGQMTASV